MSKKKPYSCAKKKSKSRIQNENYNEKNDNLENKIIQIETFYPKNLEDIGRDQFFHHYKKSQLPIRNILDKTEPHIEIEAENYLRNCLQKSIRSFCKSKEKYLFLCTTNENKKIGNGKFINKRFVVGYLKKTHYTICEYISAVKRYTIFGDIYLVPFTQELNYDNLKLNRPRAPQPFDKEITSKVLDIIHSNDNILDDCLDEMIKQEAAARLDGKIIPNDIECLEKSCFHYNDCYRRKDIKGIFKKDNISM